MGLAIWVFASFASAQATPGPSRIQERKEKPANPVAVVPAQQTPHRVVPIYGAAAPEQTLPQPPEIDWDGKLLSTDAREFEIIRCPSGGPGQDWGFDRFSRRRYL
jgi:hypothetical protein